jgi:phosphohistidine phosphatase SixA
MRQNPISALQKRLQHLFRFGLTGFGALLIALTAGAAEPAPNPAWAALQEGSVILFRHAIAPGGGDPDGMKIGDCSTQRNLDEAGRAQARRIGDQFRSHGIVVVTVLSSQWCRAHETAELAFASMVRDDANFNSFFNDSSGEAAQTTGALRTLSQWRGPGVLVVITHQVNITALTGIFPASGEGVIVRPQGAGITVLGRLKP